MKNVWRKPVSEKRTELVNAYRRCKRSIAYPDERQLYTDRVVTFLLARSGEASQDVVDDLVGELENLAKSCRDESLARDSAPLPGAPPSTQESDESR